MSLRTRWSRTWTAAAVAVALTTGILFLANPTAVAIAEDAAATQPIEKGLRVYSAGHSFHYFVPGQLAQMATAAGIKDHVQVGLSAIGGSRVIQHWNVLDDKHKSKEILKRGGADVLTLAGPRPSTAPPRSRRFQLRGGPVLPA